MGLEDTTGLDGLTLPEAAAQNCADFTKKPVNSSDQMVALVLAFVPPAGKCLFLVATMASSASLSSWSKGGVYGLSGSRAVTETTSQSLSDCPAAVKVFQDPSQTAPESSLTAETGDETGFQPVMDGSAPPAD